MATWAELDAELALWHAAGERPTFWWRDDDTEEPTPALERLVALTRKYEAPLHLAVIPAGLSDDLAAYLKTAPHVWSTQHGLAHRNNEPKGARASEIGQNRDLALQETDLRRGWALMAEADLPNRLPILVPPWNRIGEKVIPHLASWGFAALSGFGNREKGGGKGPLRHLNAHVEPLRWRPDALFAGEAKTLAQCVTHLQDRRTGVADKDEPTGLVTHHLQTPEKAWDFCDAFAELLSHKGRAQWVPLAPYLEGGQA